MYAIRAYNVPSSNRPSVVAMCASSDGGKRRRVEEVHQTKDQDLQATRAMPFVCESQTKTILTRKDYKMDCASDAHIKRARNISRNIFENDCQSLLRTILKLSMFEESHAQEYLEKDCKFDYTEEEYAALLREVHKIDIKSKDKFRKLYNFDIVMKNYTDGFSCLPFSALCQQDRVSILEHVNFLKFKFFFFFMWKGLWWSLDRAIDEYQGAPFYCPDSFHCRISLVYGCTHAVKRMSSRVDHADYACVERRFGVQDSECTLYNVYAVKRDYTDGFSSLPVGVLFPCERAEIYEHVNFFKVKFFFFFMWQGVWGKGGGMSKAFRRKMGLGD